MQTKLASMGLKCAWACACAVAFAGVGCSSSDPVIVKGTYELDLTAFDPHSGTTIYLKVKDDTGATTVGSSSVTIPGSGKAQIVVPGILENGKSYRVDFFADTDGDGAYKTPTPPTFPEHSWRRLIVGKTGGVVETFAHDSNWVDVSPF